MTPTERIFIATISFALLYVTYYTWYIHENKSEDDTPQLLGFFSLMIGAMGLLASISAP